MTIDNRMFAIVYGVITIGLFIFSIRMIHETVNKIVRLYKQIFYWGPQWRRGQEMIRRAKEYVKAHGPLVVVNKSQKGIWAITNYDSFDTKLIEVLRVAWARGASSMCQRVLVEVLPTFTFAENKASQFPAHTGEAKELENLMEHLVIATTSMSRLDVDRKHYEEVLSILAVRDPRLYIPFVSSESVSSIEEEYRKFGQTTLQQAEEVLTPPKLRVQRMGWDSGHIA